eukprot:NODE_3676_length_642_cov_1304.671164_g2638_i0.p1 GENE.NODE_3676_length_642_cov_1304.671164_g2638_i0~~NODE_3676_length_642_cov_1304.671164_g2638_i0.p1  ORF type:complete len:179 (+),score=80.21 NODE_3676_length_642_cov_1304.671164_g2638_i0:59-538(+)
MPKSFGYRARTRQCFKKDFRKKGMPTISTYLTTYKVGDYVDIKVNPTVHRGMPYKYFHGKSGVVWKVSPRAIGVAINKRVKQRIRRKLICVRTEHIQKSRCQDEFKARVRHNETVKRTGQGRRVKRLPTQPKKASMVSYKAEPIHLGAQRFVFADAYKM